MEVFIEEISFEKVKMEFSGENYGGLMRPSASIKCDLNYPSQNFNVAIVDMKYSFITIGVGYDMRFELETKGKFLVKKEFEFNERDLYECLKYLVALSQEYVNNNRGRIFLVVLSAYLHPCMKGLTKICHFAFRRAVKRNKHWRPCISNRKFVFPLFSLFRHSLAHMVSMGEDASLKLQIQKQSNFLFSSSLCHLT